MNDYEATIEAILKEYDYSPTNNIELNQATASLLQLLQEARIEELESVWSEGYERWKKAPQSDKHSQTQHVSKALFDRMAELKAKGEK